jgi:hypothetical protein
MTSLLDISEKMTYPPKPLSKYATKTARFRAAFTAIEAGMTIRRSSRFYQIKRSILTKCWKLFAKSGARIDDFIFVKNRRGRRNSLSPAGLSALKIAAHSLDSIGRPLSTCSMNLMIRSLCLKEGTGRRPCNSTVRRWRKRLGIGKKTVRNGPACRKQKSQAFYVEDYFQKLTALVMEFDIKMEYMFDFISKQIFNFIYLTINSTDSIQMK